MAVVSSSHRFAASEGATGRGGTVAQRRRLRPRTRLIVVAACLAWVLATCMYYVLVPGQPSDAAVAITYLISCLTMAVGPLARGVRPMWMWIPQMVGGLGFLTSLLMRWVPGDVVPALYPDYANFVGYGLFILTLVLLTRRVSDENDNSAFFDAGGVTIGMTLALWSWVIGPLLGSPLLSSAIVWAVYPTIDVLVLMLCVHIVLRRGEVPASMRWLLPSMGLLLFVDCCNALNATLGSGERVRWIIAGYVLSYAGIAFAVSHPSIVTLSIPPERRRTNPGTHIRTALNVFTISPAILAIAVPINGTLDAAVRSTLVAILLTILFVRLASAMSALTRAEEASFHRATHDGLTGLLNRSSLLEELTQRLRRDAVGGHRTAVVFLDCDGFKAVNDTWGHQAGDVLLQDIACRLTEQLGPGDILARHGGDEFVLVSTVEDLDEATALAGRVRASFESLTADRHDPLRRVTPSMGIAVTPVGQTPSTDEMLSRADAAMYAAKRAGRGRFVVHDQEADDPGSTEAILGTRLRQALRAGDIDVHLQPIVAGAGYDATVGWEALARWTDPELGRVSPAVFILLAERLGLIVDLGDVVLRRACAALAQLQTVYGPGVLVSVNVSPTQLTDPGLAAAVKNARDEAGLPPNSLWLEITENLLVDRGPAALATLTELRESGVRICIDDFGTGYASLATLLRLPVDCVKLDASVTARLADPVSGRRQVAAVMELIRSLGIERIVAEGVETAHQEAILAELGCPALQGWRYGRPRPLDEVLRSVGPDMPAHEVPSAVHAG